MSLDTVLQIGKIYRENENAWKYHEQINNVMKNCTKLIKIFLNICTKAIMIFTFIFLYNPSK
ncbi:MAG: hypothetical protein PWP68_642 [Rikenellaceae bacterium]|jgi:hypothetical protein|nr:hypothetical protein [Rikenellaceae bacterium]